MGDERRSFDYDPHAITGPKALYLAPQIEAAIRVLRDARDDCSDVIDICRKERIKDHLDRMAQEATELSTGTAPVAEPPEKKKAGKTK